jgi:SAM-dependent methyltransferase
MISPYYDRRAIEAKVMAGKHRAVIGGLRDKLGQLQVDFLIAHGLKPHHTLLDIGCGSLRAGVKLIKYLDAGNYFGTDLNESLLSVEYDIELAKIGLTAKLPRAQLIVDGDFDYAWCRRPFDFVLAQSVFTHLPLGFVRICLERLCGVVKVGGVPRRPSAPSTLSARARRDRLKRRQRPLSPPCLGHRVCYAGPAMGRKAHQGAGTTPDRNG